MAFLSPWRQMRVSKPWLSWCDLQKNPKLVEKREICLSSEIMFFFSKLLISPEGCNCVSFHLPALLIHAATSTAGLYILIFQCMTQDKWNCLAQWDRLCQRACLRLAGQVFTLFIHLDRGRLQFIANYFGLQLYSVFPQQVMKPIGMPTAVMCFKHAEIKKCGYTNFQNSAEVTWKWIKNSRIQLCLSNLATSIPQSFRGQNEGRATGKEYVRDKLREAENESFWRELILLSDLEWIKRRCC